MQFGAVAFAKALNAAWEVIVLLS